LENRLHGYIIVNQQLSRLQIGYNPVTSVTPLSINNLAEPSKSATGWQQAGNIPGTYLLSSILHPPSSILTATRPRQNMTMTLTRIAERDIPMSIQNEISEGGLYWVWRVAQGRM
jgi:hypothetical protein